MQKPALFFVLIIGALAILAASSPAQQNTEAPPSAGVVPDAVMLRYPDVGRDKIVFLYANDLWTVSRAGGTAEPLASPPGMEAFPKFSPDGATIAFLGNYDGGQDIYTVPAQGGIPFRVTHHPSTEVLCDWTPDGRLIYYAHGFAGIDRVSRLFTASPSGGMPQALPVPYGAVGAISGDGAWLAYTPHTRDQRTWKRYRGGMATDIWLFHLKTLESLKITDWEGTDSLPMWHDRTIYYLSDRGDNYKLNIWAYDLDAKSHEQITDFSEYDVKWPSIGPGDRGQGEIVFQNGPGLFLLDLRTRNSAEVKVIIPGALSTIRTRAVDAAEYLQAWNISPTGKRAVVQARGDIWTLPAEKGSPRNLTRTSGAAERDPAWSPDGRWIAYFSDAAGEYELFIAQADGKGETRQLTSGSRTFYFDPQWSPDSKHILFTDKAGNVVLHTIEGGETKIIDRDEWAGRVHAPSWSHDSRWLAYSKNDRDALFPSLWLYSLESGELQRVTSGAFPDSWPVFDRKGDYLYYASGRVLESTSGGLGDEFLYREIDALMAAPLRADIKYPWLPESDEETVQDGDKKDKDGKKDKGGAAENGADSGAEAKDDEGDGGEKDGSGAEEGGAEGGAAQGGAEGGAAQGGDPVSGTWEGTAETPEGSVAFTLTLELHADNSVTGTLSSQIFSGDVAGTYNPAEKTIVATITLLDGPIVSVEAKVDNGTLAGSAYADGPPIAITAARLSAGAGDAAPGDADKKKDKPREKVEITVEGFESRAFMLPVPKGDFFGLAVNEKNQLVYTRMGKGIMLFDLADKKKEEKTIAPGGGFTMSADGKKLLTHGGGASICDASAGAKPKKVPTEGMTAFIDPRAEWRQLFVDSWRLERDFFYVDNLHGVDWDGMRRRYEKMLDHCVTREDVGYVISEMIAELNVGHAYYGGGDTEDQPRVRVGLLGIDFELSDGAYRISKIVEGAPWDADARNPLRAAGIDVKEGEYLLAVNGVPVDAGKDPWAAFLDLAGRTVTLTVSAEPILNASAREVVVTTLRSEDDLRYRAWVERNRAYVDAKSSGLVGYIHVPDTGWNGRTEFVRQYFGQVKKKALIVDERWNGGGFDPACFIDMLHRPITNFWARRDGRDASSAEQSHQGPKCMLINGQAGSGGDNFPWLFRHAQLGKLIGTRTWGGLVGLSGNPGLIDGASVTVPTFGFYETDGTWGVEGHGVDPDIEILDDPARMQNGGDPQLDAAIDLMIEEIESYPYVLPKRPASPNRSGMGLPASDR